MVRYVLCDSSPGVYQPLAIPLELLLGCNIVTPSLISIVPWF